MMVIIKPDEQNGNTRGTTTPPPPTRTSINLTDTAGGVRRLFSKSMVGCSVEAIGAHWSVRCGHISGNKTSQGLYLLLPAPPSQIPPALITLPARYTSPPLPRSLAPSCSSPSEKPLAKLTPLPKSLLWGVARSHFTAEILDSSFPLLPSLSVRLSIYLFRFLRQQTNQHTNIKLCMYVCMYVHLSINILVILSEIFFYIYFPFFLFSFFFHGYLAILMASLMSSCSIQATVTLL